MKSCGGTQVLGMGYPRLGYVVEAMHASVYIYLHLVAQHIQEEVKRFC